MVLGATEVMATGGGDMRVFGFDVEKERTTSEKGGAAVLGERNSIKNVGKGRY